MPIDYEKVVKESFQNVGPKNPLKRLSDSDKRLLLAFLDVYVRAPDLAPAYLLWEKAARIATEANSLGRSIRSVVFEGHLAEVLAPFVEGFQDLPARLLSFSLHLGVLLDNAAGKRGHKGKVQKNIFLIMASELVRLKTGNHYDEHLAELLQTVNPMIESTNRRIFLEIPFVRSESTLRKCIHSSMLIV
jgi:hypothetical protein